MRTLVFALPLVVVSSAFAGASSAFAASQGATPTAKQVLPIVRAYVTANPTFTHAPSKTTITNASDPLKLPAFNTHPGKTSKPGFGGTGGGQNVHFDAGNVYFTRSNKALWYNVEGSGFGKVTSGLWYKVPFTK